MKSDTAIFAGMRTSKCAWSTQPSFFQSKTLEIPCDSSHVGEDLGTLAFVSEIRFSILGAEDDVVQKLLMCAWHFTPLSYVAPPGLSNFSNVHRCLTAPAKAIPARWASLRSTYSHRALSS
jgi:hypothetical protein